MIIVYVLIGFLIYQTYNATKVLKNIPNVKHRNMVFRYMFCKFLAVVFALELATCFFLLIPTELTIAYEIVFGLVYYLTLAIILVFELIYIDRRFNKFIELKNVVNMRRIIPIVDVNGGVTFSTGVVFDRFIKHGYNPYSYECDNFSPQIQHLKLCGDSATTFCWHNEVLK